MVFLDSHHDTILAAVMPRCIKKNSTTALDDIKDKDKVAYPVQIATYRYHLAHTSSVLQSNFNEVMA